MNVAFIPVRGGSKSIPLKNIKILFGKPLVYWGCKAACECKDIDIVYVATDSDVIKDTVEAFDDEIITKKLKVIGRNPENASDTAPTKDVVLEFCMKYDFENLILIQATSPLLKSYHLEKGIEALNMPGTNSVISVVRQKRFNYSQDENGYLSPINHDIYNRPRRQNYDGYLVENGAFYITSKEGFLKNNNLMWGNIRGVEMEEETYIEIDEPTDWMLIEKIMEAQQKSEQL